MVNVIGLDKPNSTIEDLIHKWDSAAESADFYGHGENDELVKYFRYFIEDLKQLKKMEDLRDEQRQRVVD